MTDTDLRALERAARTAPDDPWARYAHRCALVRCGRGAEAGLEVGDLVLVIERHTPIHAEKGGREALEGAHRVQQREPQILAFRGLAPRPAGRARAGQGQSPAPRQ